MKQLRSYPESEVIFNTTFCGHVAGHHPSTQTMVLKCDCCGKVVHLHDGDFMTGTNHTVWACKDCLYEGEDD